MKKLFLQIITIVLVVQFNSTNAQWFLQESNSQRNLKDINIFNEDKVIIVGSYGTIRKTFDGGNNWIIIPHDTADQPNSIFFVNDSIGWMAGAGISWGGGGGAIQKTTDGGSVWTNQYNFFGISMSSVDFLDENIGWAAGTDWGNGPSWGVFIKTTDGGTNWEYLSTDTLGGLWFSTFFLSNNIGWLAGINGWSNSRIIRTSDGGNSWFSSDFINVILNSIYFIDQNTGWATGWDFIDSLGVIIKTTDGGESWVSQTTEVNNALNDIYFIDENTGWAVGLGGIILNSSDGGNNWFSQESGTDHNLNTIRFLDENIGWAIGDSGTILKTLNGGDPIPVEFTSFTATPQNDFVELNWTTATETNNHGFEVQRSIIYSEFVTLGFVEGNGTTTKEHHYSYKDKDVSGFLHYRLKQIDYDGSSTYSNVVEVEWRAFNSYVLEQNYPNPFNPTTTISFNVAEKTNVKIAILNVIGEEVAVVLNEEKNAGYYQVDFNALNLPSGVYFYQLKSDSFIDTRKMILLK